MNTLIKNRIVSLVRSPIVSTANAINNEATPCIAFAYLSSYITNKGYKCNIVDSIAEGLGKIWTLRKYTNYVCKGLTFEETLDKIPLDTEVIGFSVMFSGEWPVVRDFINMARKRFPGALFVAGGEHTTALTEYTMKDCQAIDICVRGEGEATFLSILDAYYENKPYDTVDANFAYRDTSGQIILKSNSARIKDVDSIPWPTWPEGYLEKFWEKGKSFGVQTERDIPIMASRGCPYKCTFCSNAVMWNARYMTRSVDDLLAEMKHYMDRYNATGFQFYDLTAMTKKSWIIEFCNKLIDQKFNIKWSLPSGTRSEVLNSEVLGLLKKSGCNYLVYAPESGSEESLIRIKKLINKKKFTDSVLEAKEQGLVLRTNMIIGFPHETRRDVFKTIRYGLYLAFKGVDEVSINIFSPYPGTEIFQNLINDNKIELNDEYFLNLTSLNSDLFSLRHKNANPFMGSRELAIYRTGFLLLNYAIGYIFFPRRIWRSIRNIFMGSNETATVFEHRLKDLINREKFVGI